MTETLLDIITDGWVSQALCAKYRVTDGDDPWYPEKDSALAWAKAKAICQQCPVKAKCLEDALDQERGRSAKARFGMRGAKTPIERYYLTNPKPVRTTTKKKETAK